MLIDWDPVKPIIFSLYVTQKRSLREVRQSLSKNNGFSASIRSYRGKLKEWRFIRKQDAVNHSSQVERALRSDVAQSPKTNHTTSNIALQYSSLHPPSSDDASWHPAILQFGLVPDQVEQLPSNFGHLLHNSYTFMNIPTAYQNHSNPSGPLIPPQSSLALDRSDEHGRTSLHHAVLKRSLEDVDSRLSLGSNPNIPDGEGKYPLHYASEKGWHEIILLLLKRGADSKVRNKLDQTPLHLAAKFPKAVKALLSSHPEVSGLDAHGRSPLHLAISAAALDRPPRNTSIEQLIYAGGDLTLRNKNGETPFELILGPIAAKSRYHGQYITLFLENGANIYSHTSTGKFLFEVYVGNVLDRLLISDFKANSTLRNTDCKMFIAKGAKIDMRLGSGKSFFGVITRSVLADPHRDHQLLRILCEGISPNIPDAEGKYPIHHISGNSFWLLGEAEKCFKILLRRGAGINQKCKAGETPLTTHLKSIIDCPRAVLNFTYILLQDGADPMLPNSHGDLPIYIAARIKDKQHRDKIVETILDDLILWDSEAWSEEGSELAKTPGYPWWTMVFDYLPGGGWLDPIHFDILKSGPDGLPPNEAEYIGNKVLSYIAVDHLDDFRNIYESHKKDNGLNHADTQHYIDLIVLILRDCVKYGIEVDGSWYRYLLELFP